MSRRPRVGIAGVFHESNTFVQRPMTLDDFRDAWHERDDIVTALAGTQTVTGGFIDGARSHGFDVAPAVHIWGTPAGPVTRPAFDALCDALRSGLERAGRLDGLLLELHGAMVADGVAAADGVLAQLARFVVGDAPIVAVIDPHANISEAVVDSVDGLITYRTNPHVDMSDRGVEAAALLDRILSGACRPCVAATRVPVIAPAVAQATADQPLASLLSQARALECRKGVLSVSIAFGFAYADVPEVAMTAIVVSDGDQALAEELARDLGRSAWEARTAFERRLVAPAEAVAIAASTEGVTMLADTGDNVGGGAPGDSTVIARAVLDHDGVRAVTTVCDPGAVAAAAAAGIGAQLDVVLGEPPLRVTAQVRALPSGRYVNDGPLARGVEFDMGDVAVLDAARLTIVAQSTAVMANDQNMLRSVGVEVAAYDAVILKGAAAVRAGWAGVAARFVDVATPGPTASDLSTLPYRNVGRLWPLERFSWQPGDADGA